tara:strand:- start:3949 stop:4731 length:783 start_codon:yes stop_codon:yes gene_type:complete
MNQASLFGGKTHTRSQVADAYTPAGTDTYTPVPYIKLLDTVDRILQDNGLVVANEGHQLVKPMKDVRHPSAFGQFFSVLNLANMDDDAGQVGFAVGIRSSHDMSLAASVCAGSNVFICSNLCFSAEWIASRRHTSNVLADLPVVIDSIIKQFPEAQEAQNRLFDQLRDTAITERQALWLGYQGVKENAINSRDLVPIMEEFVGDRNKDQHGDNSTLWNLYNAGTEVHKGIQGRNMVTASSRALDWHSLFNKAAKLGVDSV